MTEKEKMLAGRLYHPADPELARERAEARRKIFLFHQAQGKTDDAKAESLLRKIVGSLGEDAWIEPPFFFDYGYNIFLGRRFYANTNLTVLDSAPVTFGDDVMLGPNVSLYTVSHPMDAAERATGLEYAKPITIEDGVWIGGSVTVIGGVVVGRNSVVGAGSVVTRDVPPNVFAAGNPCRVVRELDEDRLRRTT